VKFSWNYIFATMFCFGLFSVPESSHAAIISVYEFNNTTTDSVRGAAGVGTFVGTTSYVPGMIGNGMAFNGSSYLVAPVVGGGLSALSISAWVKFNSNTSWATIVKNWGESSTGAFHLGLDNATGNISDYITSSGGTLAATDSSTITTGQWYHVVTTFNGSANRHILYVNGVSKASVSASGTLTTLGTKMSMGAKLNDSQSSAATINTGYLNGVLDDVSFYDEALSSSQITTLYNNGLSGIGAVPEPSALSLLAVGLGGLASLRRRRS
jgi:hypothetical protein